MTEEKILLTVGGLLHDIGKVIHRQGDGRAHSISGYDYLKNDVGIKDGPVLEQVKYHHGSALKDAPVSPDSFAYITYIADNIASAADRRKGEREDRGFEKTLPLEPVFNILNKNNKRMYYHPGMLDGSINYPTEEKQEFSTHFYMAVRQHITDNLKGIAEWNDEYINSLLEVLEGNLAFVPSSTAKDELADISLYDHVKLTAAIGTCIYDYLNEQQVTDYKTVLFKNAEEFYKEKAFLLFSMDISGIQSFIYTIHSKGALKMLRAKSFYLEIMMEHIMDELLSRLELSRANLIYSGGGHCYMLLPNTKAAKDIIKKFEAELNQWFLDNFDISLYIAAGYAECSAKSLKNEPEGSYEEIFRNAGNMISAKKSARYSCEQIIKLNRTIPQDNTRECRVCKKTAKLNDRGECEMCSSISGLSVNILSPDYKFFAISNVKRNGALSLPFGKYMTSETESSLRKLMRDEEKEFVRAYSKNEMFTGKHIATRLWIGNYSTGETFEELAKASGRTVSDKQDSSKEEKIGIERIGILRADVDNLGQAIVSGFKGRDNSGRYSTLTRTATLSRQLSMFFKYYINDILGRPVYNLDGVKRNGGRKAVIIYSGGDDLFIAGAWNDVVELAVDIKDAFEKYTEGTLTISAGIGVYRHDYPISVSAYEVAELEDDSKHLPQKNALTFLPDGETHKEEESNYKINDAAYHWDEFVNEVIGEKYKTISSFLMSSKERGKNFLYNLLDLVRHQDEKINLARYIYLLARMEPEREAREDEKASYREFSKKMYEWIKDEKACRHLKTAINLYAYMTREEEDK